MPYPESVIEPPKINRRGAVAAAVAAAYAWMFSGPVTQTRPHHLLAARTIEQRVVSGGPLPLTVGYGARMGNTWDTLSKVEMAINAGYRLFDTAQKYKNEGAVGEALSSAIAEGRLKREDIFVTTRVSDENMGYERTTHSVLESDALLGLEGGFDLVLVHEPHPFAATSDLEEHAKEMRRSTWKALEELQELGQIKQIGVSNFGEGHMKELFEYAKFKPAVSQFEVHPYNQRTELVNFCKGNGIAVNAFSPLGGKGKLSQLKDSLKKNGDLGHFSLTNELLNDPVLNRIGANHGKSVAQVILRWHLQRGITPMPQSSTPARMHENYNVFDFKLSNEDMDAIGELDRGHFVIPNADDFA